MSNITEIQLDLQNLTNSIISQADIARVLGTSRMNINVAGVICLTIIFALPFVMIGYMVNKTNKEDEARTVQWEQYQKRKARRLAQEEVVFNTKTLIYHSPDCDSAERCTVNCITVTREEAAGEGGRPCKVCGGGLDEDEQEEY